MLSKFHITCPITFKASLVMLLLNWFLTLNGQEIALNKVPFIKGENIDFVTGIAQDLNGIMWFSTKVGLVSYDGMNLTVYKNNPINPNSLISNFTESLCADNNQIWVGTLGHGLDLFDPTTGIFTHYRHDPNDPTSISNDTVTKILKDQQGTLWIGTHGGLNQFDPITKHFIHFKHDPDDTTTLSNNQVRALYEDRQGTLWVGTGSPYADNGGGPLAGGLNRMDKKTGTFTRYLHDPKNSNSLINNKIGALYEDDKGVLWIGLARNGLCKMNTEKETIERLVYDPANPGKFNSLPIFPETADYEHISFINQDDSGNFWIGTTESGVFYYDQGHGKTPEYGKEFKHLEGFSDRGAWDSYTSRDGVFWVGGLNGNIYRINSSLKKTPHFAMPAAVNSFYEEPNGDLWLAAQHKIIKTERSTGISKHHDVDLTPEYDEDDNLQIIREDRQGNIWIGGNGGVTMWDNVNKNVLLYKNDPKIRSSLSNNNVITLYVDNQENIWVGTTDGLNLLNRERGDFKKFYMNQVDTSYIGLNIVTAVLQAKGGQFWVGTWNGGGVYAFDPMRNKSKVYLSGTSVVCLFEDSKNEIWLGSNYGLFRYDPGADNFVRYLDPFQVNGISDVFGIVEDNEHYLWVSTSYGLARINPERNETNRLEKAYGLENSSFVWNSCYKGRDGSLYFGDDNGYYAFNPAEIILNATPPEIVFTGFRLADQIINPGDNSPLKKKMLLTNEIRLRNDQNTFSFDYAIIDYVNPEENRLTYFLENYDNNWQQPNSERRAYYFNVPPGKYTFHVKGANSYGIWALKKINLTILPPWWKTYWAYGIYALLFILAVFGFDRIQRRRIRLMERQRTYQRELTQAKEIEKAYTELKTTQFQLIQSEKMASLGELTAGIAHEIQNPLNFVNNFSEVSIEMVDELKQESKVDGRRSAVGGQQPAIELLDNIKQNLEKILHHGKRADAIVKGMLQHSRTSTGQKEPTDINALAEEYLRLSYHGLRAKDKSFNADFKTDFDINLPKVNVIPQDIGRVLLNLINNAFYAVSTRNLSAPSDLTGLQSKVESVAYKPTVTVSTKRSLSLQGEGRGEVLIIVKDNGPGIPPEVLDKIFQPFFTTKPTGQGTGLGLSLSYDIIKAHGGELKVTSHVNEGAEFIIRLPIG